VDRAGLEDGKGATTVEAVVETATKSSLTLGALRVSPFSPIECLRAVCH
jgi:hypothetical protein